MINKLDALNEFVRIENVKIFEEKLKTETDPVSRNLLLKMLTEAKAWTAPGLADNPQPHAAALSNADPDGLADRENSRSHMVKGEKTPQTN